jgi:hypothetical protein
VPLRWNKDPWAGQTVVYHYGCPVWADFGAGKGRDDIAIEQLYLANRFWNDLVEANKAHEAKRAEIESKSQAVGPLIEAKDQAESLVLALCRSVKDERARLHLARERGERPGRDGLNSLLNELSAAREELKAAREQLKVAKQMAKEVLGPEYAAAREALRAEESRLHKKAYTVDGLYWPTALDVTRRYGTAVQRVISDRSNGLPSELKFHRFDGTGTLAMIFNAGRGGRTIEKLSEPGYLGVRVEGEGRHRVLVMRVTGVKQGDHSLRVPFVMHRPIPEDADISEIRVTRRRVGMDFRVSIAFTCLVPQAKKPEGGNAVGVKLHWRRVDDGHIEVARVSSSGPMGPLRSLAEKGADKTTSNAPDIAHVVVEMPDGTFSIRARSEWLTLLERDESIRSVRDKNLDQLRGELVAALLANPDLPPVAGMSPQELAGRVAKWRSPRRFAALRREPALIEAVPSLRDWFTRDRHLCQYESHERSQVIAARDDAWHKVAAWLCDGATIVAIDGQGLEGPRRKRQVGDSDLDVLAKIGRQNMQRSAPGGLRAAIKTACARRNIQLNTAKKETEGAKQ